MIDFIEKEFEAQGSELDTVNDYIGAYLENHDASFKIITKINIVIEEIFVNVALYAYPNKDGKVNIQLWLNEDNYVFIRFIDSGVPFNPLAREDPDITQEAEDRPIGGLGIFMVKKMMDSVDYEYTNNQNILTISKNILA